MRTFFILFFVGIGWFGLHVPSAEGSIHQKEIDAAYRLIFQTDIGRSICRHILGAQPEAMHMHLGVSLEAAKRIVKTCPKRPSHRWIHPTRPEDIRKITLKPAQPRKFKILVSQTSFPIESWTEPFTNTTVLVTPTLPITLDRWVQMLAHEMAVYFDSKVSPAHPDAEQIPELKNLNLQYLGPLDPLVAVSNPLHGHALTFLRALIVEEEILRELLKRQALRPLTPLIDGFQQQLTSAACGHECVRNLMVRLRTTLMPISLPLLAFAPHYRSLILSALPRMNLSWPEETWQRARLVLNHLPVNFLNGQSGGDPVQDMKKAFYANLAEYEKFADVAHFLELDLWAIEKQALFPTTVNGNRDSFIEYMKRPLLSGYNIGLSSGPRVRIRTGNVE